LLLFLLLGALSSLYLASCTAPCHVSNSTHQTHPTHPTPQTHHLVKQVSLCSDFYSHACAREQCRQPSGSFANILERTRGQFRERVRRALASGEALTSSASKGVHFLVQLYQKCSQAKEKDTA